MFEGALNRGPAAKPRLVTGTVMSIALHGALLAGAVWLSSQAPDAPPDPPEKPFPTVRLDPKRVRAKSHAAATQRPARPKPVAKKPRGVITLPSRTPVERPKDLEPPPDVTPELPPGDDEDLRPGHELGECEGPDCEDPPPCPEGGCELGENDGPTVYSFDSRMTRPVKLSGAPPEYTREAREAGVQGVMVVKCVVPVHGALERCRVIKPLPFMEQAVLDALDTWRYAPATLDGQPVAVDYVFQIFLRIPR